MKDMLETDLTKKEWKELKEFMKKHPYRELYNWINHKKEQNLNK